MGLIKKIDGYYFRGYIPKCLIFISKKKTLDKKLYTTNKKQALKNIKKVQLEFDYYILGLKMAITNKNDLIRRIDTYIEKYFQSREKNLYNLPNDDLDKLFNQGYFYNNIEALQEALSYKNFDLLPFFDEILEDALDKNISLFTKDEIAELKSYLADKLLRNEEILRQRVIEGSYYFKPSHSTDINIVDKNTTSLKSNNPNLKEWIKRFINYKEIEGIKEKEISKYKVALNSFYLEFGNINLIEITKEDFLIYKKQITKLPLRWVDRSEFKNLKTLESIIQKNLQSKEPLDTLSITTVKKYITVIKSFFNYCIDKNVIKNNVADNVRVKSDEARNKVKKLPYSSKDLEIMFSNKYFTKDLNKNLEKNIQNILIPIIALYTGMRLNEICSLYKDNIKVEKIGSVNYHYFDVTNDYDTTVKNDTSIRNVPIHKDLIELGFLRYCEQYIEGERIFPNLTKTIVKKDSEKGRYSKKFSTWFDRFNRLYVTKDKGKTFHCFRRNFIDNLKQSRIEPFIINAIDGHSDENKMLDLYSEDYKIEILDKAVQSIDYKITGLEKLIKEIALKI